MALTFGLYSDAALTTRMFSELQVSIDGDTLADVNLLAYFGSPRNDRKVVAAVGNVSVTCLAPAGIDAQISIPASPGSWASSVDLGQRILGGQAVAIPIHFRIRVTDISAISSPITIAVTTPDLLEYQV